MLSLVITHFIFTVTLEIDIHMPIVQMRKLNLRNLYCLSRAIQPVKGRTWTWAVCLSSELTRDSVPASRTLSCHWLCILWKCWAFFLSWQLCLSLFLVGNPHKEVNLSRFLSWWQKEVSCQRVYKLVQPELSLMVFCWNYPLNQDPSDIAVRIFSLQIQSNSPIRHS